MFTTSFNSTLKHAEESFNNPENKIESNAQEQQKKS